MRIVIDTNVLISGAFFSGAPSRIIDACVRGKFDLLLSADIIEEYRRVGEIFTRKQPNVPFDRFLGILVSKAVFVEPTNLETVVCRDPDDMKFLECALASNAKCLISGDKDLLVIKDYKGITIYTPRVFVDVFLD
jgi:uncharacterized protein